MSIQLNSQPQSVVNPKVATAINATGNLTIPAILGGIVTSTTAAAVTLTIPASTASAFYGAIGSPGYQANGTLLIVNTGGANAITLASSDANMVITGLASTTIAANTARQLTWVVTNPGTPQISFYG